MSRKQVKCSRCDGTGVLRIEIANVQPGELPCLPCKGSGRVLVDIFPEERPVCRRCNGMGFVHEAIPGFEGSRVFPSPCPECTGYLRVLRFF